MTHDRIIQYGNFLQPSISSWRFVPIHLPPLASLNVPRTSRVQGCVSSEKFTHEPGFRGPHQHSVSDILRGCQLIVSHHNGERWDTVEWSPSNSKLNPAANFSMLESAILDPLIQSLDATIVGNVLYCTVQPEGCDEENLQEACITMYSACARPKGEFYQLL